jgi:putative oxidoreductase
MERLLGRYEPFLYAVLRVVAGLMFVLHGTRKLWGWPGDRPPSTATLSIVGGWIEVVGGIMIATGFLAGFAAFICSGMMAYAYWFRHYGEGEVDAFWPIVNRGELAVVYCFLWLYVASRGGFTRGRESRDRVSEARDTTTQS